MFEVLRVVFIVLVYATIGAGFIYVGGFLISMLAGLVEYVRDSRMHGGHPLST